jgi:phenylacetate-coenzyme A ligase PaaK-like adenylate-forming protein
MKALCLHHYKHCEEYKKIIDAFNVDIERIEKIEDIPFIPVRLFKMFELYSVDKADIFKTMTSSGTTGQAVSKIYLDKDTAANQQKTLVKIVSNFTGSSRMPMLVIDSPSVVKDRKMFSARGAGILGFSIFGADITYALDDEMNINFAIIEKFLEKHQGRDILLFGFTFMIWQYFYKELKKQNKQLDLSRAVLIHGGGWKKLANEAVSAERFKEELHSVCKIKKIHDYYGMIEQTGTIYMECEQGHLHTSGFSDVIVRNSKDFSVCQTGEKGLVQLLSLLPRSYPGHSILSEDEGIILGEDNCPCQRKGKYFKILGRVKNAEIRGCSDTHEQRR